VFRVEAESLGAYFAFDPLRRNELKKLDKLITSSAPGLKRYFHRGTPEGEPGMRFKMIGYGKYHYLAGDGRQVEWPAVGVALQRSYISVYFSISNKGAPLIQSYAGRLGEFRSGQNNFSFRAFEDLDPEVASALFAEAERLFRSGAWG